MFSTSHFSVSVPGLCFHLIPVWNLGFFCFSHPLLSQPLFLTLPQSCDISASLQSSPRLHTYICTHTLLPKKLPWAILGFHPILQDFQLNSHFGTHKCDKEAGSESPHNKKFSTFPLPQTAAYAYQTCLSTHESTDNLLPDLLCW